jgi:Asp-tRNA(Asn)/Glu-tRNA(Gln) amidotransferase A subunit family amidase
VTLWSLSAREAGRRLREGEIASEELVSACLERIAAVDGDVQAWAHLDPEYALTQARMLDSMRKSGSPVGPLHGLPVGIKDIIDTEALPTENGTVLDSGRRPREDASVVTQLRQAGAVIMGKTVSTELAVYSPGKTRNPHNAGHTPGGSSSGSAAAVAAGMVPLAVGTQTNGSVIRPASFCGVYGFKPTHGLISRSGILKQSPPLDTVGVFGRSVKDAAMVAEAIMAYDDRDPHSRLQARPRLLDTAMQDPPLEPVFAFVKTPAWDRVTDDCKDAFLELADVLGARCDEIALPGPFDGAHAVHRTIMLADLARNFSAYYRRGAEQLSDILRGMIEEGQGTLAVDYNVALDWIELLNGGLDEVFTRYDAILTPAAPGEAPAGLDATGDPALCTLWTLCGTPAITLPLMEGTAGLPLGVQLVGRRGDDARLLRTAHWLAEHVEQVAE